MYYLVDSSNFVVGKIDSLDGEPPLGYRVVKMETKEAVGRKLIDNKLMPVEPVATPAPLVEPVERVRFWNTPEFKQARIKANKDPVLAISFIMAVVSELQGDQVTLKGSMKSISDLIRASETVQAPIVPSLP